MAARLKWAAIGDFDLVKQQSRAASMSNVECLVALAQPLSWQVFAERYTLKPARPVISMYIKTWLGRQNAVTSDYFKWQPENDRILKTHSISGSSNI